MPQISQIAATYASQLFWLLLCFGLIYFVIGRGMVPKVEATVDDRDKKISDDLAAAKAASTAADDAEERYRVEANEARAEAQELIREAKQNVAEKTEAKLSRAKASVDKKLAEAEASIATARASAMTEIEAVATEAAQDIVAKLAGEKVSATAAKSAVQSAMRSA